MDKKSRKRLRRQNEDTREKKKVSRKGTKRKPVESQNQGNQAKGKNREKHQIKSKAKPAKNKRKAKAKEHSIEAEKSKSKVEKKTSKGDAEGETPVCPITLEPFVNPCLLGDGVTYERDSILEWIEANPKATSGPTGIPLESRIWCSNEAFLSTLRHPETKLVCTLTHEKFRSPVLLVPKHKEWTEHYVLMNSTFEAEDLIEALKATWGKYDFRLARHYVDTSPSSLSLNDTHVLIPNRILWQQNRPVQLPALPHRSPLAQFNPQLIKGRYCNVHVTCDNLQDSLAQENWGAPVKLPHTVLNEMHIVFEGIHAIRWYIRFHGKSYVFRNCLFERCFFTEVCWCNVEFISCKFDKCTFDDCMPRGDLSNNTNCTFLNCVLIQRSPEHGEMAPFLLGTQTDQTREKENQPQLHVIQCLSEDMESGAS